eukprot:6182699-Prorocentrum_lima.AAC.1
MKRGICDGRHVQNSRRPSGAGVKLEKGRLEMCRTVRFRRQTPPKPALRKIFTGGQRKITL